MKGRVVATFKNTAHDSRRDENGVVQLHVKRVFEGDLKGEGTAILQAHQPSPEEFSYVGTDIFSGSLGNRKGGFMFQHGGIHSNDGLQTFGFIAPRSGTGDLEGISGKITIEVSPEGHKLTLDYILTLATPQKLGAG